MIETSEGVFAVARLSGYSGQEMYSIILNEVDVEPGSTGQLDRDDLQ